jgi:hypothetical protein
MQSFKQRAVISNNVSENTHARNASIYYDALSAVRRISDDYPFCHYKLTNIP